MAYNLAFISDEDLLKHVAETVNKYRFKMDLNSFNANIIDPIKLTFDAKVYQKSFKTVIEDEIFRQIDKTNNNHIGYFHQNIFNYLGKGWHVPKEGFDVINEELNYFVEIKNKHNTMNSSSAQKTYMKMQSMILNNDQATCFLVEIIAKHSQDITWAVSLDNKKYSHNRIRRLSIDRFYSLVTGHKNAFKDLCDALPTVISDAIAHYPMVAVENSVYNELKAISPDMLTSLYLLAFKEYEGFL